MVLAEATLPEMEDYGATQEQIDDVKLDIDLFLEQRGKPRAYRVASRVATQNLEELFQTATPLLNKLDNVLKRFKRSNVSFYNGYIAARQVIDK